MQRQMWTDNLVHDVMAGHKLQFLHGIGVQFFENAATVSTCVTRLTLVLMRLENGFSTRCARNDITASLAGAASSFALDACAISCSSSTNANESCSKLSKCNLKRCFLFLSRCMRRSATIAAWLCITKVGGGFCKQRRLRRFHFGF